MNYSSHHRFISGWYRISQTPLMQGRELRWNSAVLTLRARLYTYTVDFCWQQNVYHAPVRYIKWIRSPPFDCVLYVTVVLMQSTSHVRRLMQSSQSAGIMPDMQSIEQLHSQQYLKGHGIPLSIRIHKEQQVLHKSL